MSSCSGMYQNQPLLVRRLHDQRGALVAAGVAVRALAVGPDRALVEQRIPDAAGLEAVHAASPPGRWRRRPPAPAPRGACRPGPAIFTPTARSPSKSTSRTWTPSRASTPCSRAFSSSIWSNSLRIDLPGLRALVRLVVPEVERRRQLAVGADELHAVLLDEVAGLHLRQHAEPLQHPVGLGDQRLADVEAREASRARTAGRARPCWASSVETVEPAGPPPMTTTSGDVDEAAVMVRRVGAATTSGSTSTMSPIAAAVEQHFGAAAVERARLAHPEHAHHLGVGRRPRRTRAACS